MTPPIAAFPASFQKNINNLLVIKICFSVLQQRLWV